MRTRTAVLGLLVAAAGGSTAFAGSRVTRGLPVFAVGGGHMLLIKPNGFVSAWGDNAGGQLGDRPANSHTRPFENTALADLIEVAAGDAFSLGIDQDGNGWAWGRNGSCQLGNGGTADAYQPQSLGFGVRTVAAGKSHALSLSARGDLYAWGANLYGEAGSTPPANKPPVCSPQQIVAPGAPFIDAGAGDGFSVALAADGSLWAWGNNRSGQLGLGAGAAAEVATPKKVTGGKRWVAFAVGDAHVVAIQDNGTLWGWGRNDGGQLAASSTTNPTFNAPRSLGGTKPFKAVAAGRRHTLALMANGTLWGVGENLAGQLGLGTNASQVALTQSQGKTSDWQYIGAGGDSSAALKADGTFYAWGGNAKSQLGTGNTTNKNAAGTALFTKVKPGFVTDVSEIRADGTIRTWAGGGAPQPLGGSTNSLWIDVARGSSGFWLAVRSDGSLWAWGQNSSGELGNGDTTPSIIPNPIRIGTGDTWVDVSAALTSSYGLTADGRLYTWGENDENGKLGTGDTNTRYVPTRIGASRVWAAMAADFTNGYAITSGGVLYGWGENSDGRVGNGEMDQNLYVTAPVLAGASLGRFWLAVDAGPVAVDHYGVAYHWGGTEAVAMPTPEAVLSYTSSVAAGELLQVWGSAFRTSLGQYSSTLTPQAFAHGGRGIFNGPAQLTTRGKVMVLDGAGNPVVLDQIY